METVVVNYQEMANNDVAAALSHHNVLPEFKDMSVEDRRSFCDNDRLPFKVAILNITGELNVGTIIRNSLLMGAQEVLIIGRRRVDKRGTVGSENYIRSKSLASVCRTGRHRNS
jgi:tRNA G18 (ribose-2'-O)-methylase SpoU